MSLNDIYNYLPIEHLFETSGQPSESQFSLIHEAGYQMVINLAPNSMLENVVINEAEILKTLGIKYIHTPVSFQRPTDKDFEKFVSTLQENSDQKVWIHCAANMRVSAFTYRYRCSVLGEDPKVAEADLRQIWVPFGAWKQFIQ